MQPTCPSTPPPPSIHSCPHFLLNSTETSGSFLSRASLSFCCAASKAPRPWSTPPDCLLHSRSLGCQALTTEAQPYRLVLHDSASFLLNGCGAQISMAGGGNERCREEKGSLGVYTKFREAGDERQEKAGTQRELRQREVAACRALRGQELGRLGVQDEGCATSPHSRDPLPPVFLKRAYLLRGVSPIQPRVFNLLLNKNQAAWV